MLCPQGLHPAVLLLTHRSPRGDVSTVCEHRAGPRVPVSQVGALCLRSQRPLHDIPRLLTTFHYHPSVTQLSSWSAEGDQLTGLPGILPGSVLQVLHRKPLSARKRDSWSPRESPWCQP